METQMLLNREEISELPYGLLCETRESSIWKTKKRKIWWNAQFTPAEQKEAEKIFKLCHSWYLTTGTPEKYAASPATLFLWRRLGDFCMQVTR